MIDTSTFSEPTREWLENGQRIGVGNYNIFVYEKGSGPNILFIHGFPTSCFDWKAIIDRLSGQFRCVAFDFIGFGFSDKPDAFSYSLFQQTDLVESLMKTMGIDETHVMSHDMGTSAHTELLARQLEGRLGFRILTSTFLNGSMIKDMASLTDFQRMLEDPQQLGKAMQVCAEMIDNYVPGLKRLMKRPEVVSGDEETIMKEIMLFQEGNRRIPHVYAYVRERYLHKERWLGALRDADMPVQIVWATEDPVANRAMGKALAAQTPKARYIEVSESGHFIPIEAPEEVADAFLSFVGA